MRVQQEVHAVDAARLPALERAHDALRPAQAQSLAGLLARLGPGGLAAELGQEAERRIRPAGKDLAHRGELGRQIVERVRHLPPAFPPHLVVLVAVEEVHRRDLVVDEVAHGVAELDAAPVLGDLLLLLGELAEREAEAAEPAVRGVQLRARARHRHPHRRVRPLVDLGQDGPRRHRPELALDMRIAPRSTSWAGIARTRPSSSWCRRGWR